MWAAGIGIIIKIKELRDIVPHRPVIDAVEFSRGQPGIDCQRNLISVSNRLNNGRRPADRVAGSKDTRHIDFKCFAY